MPSIVYSPVDTRVSPGELPRMQPAQQTDAVGEALQRLGQSGSQLADTMHHLDYQQHISDGITSIKQNLMSADEQFTQYMEQAKGQVPENGAGYTDLFADKFSDWQNAFLNQYSDPRLKKIAAEQAATLHNRFYNQASQWQIETNRAWRVNTFDDSIQHDSAIIDADP